MIFVSYNSQQVATTDRLVAQLERAGIGCWYAARDIPPGHLWDEAIMTAIEACNAFLLLFSAASDDSLQVKRELMLADVLGKPVFWLKTQDAEPRRLRYLLIAAQSCSLPSGGVLPASLIEALVVRAPPRVGGEANQSAPQFRPGEQSAPSSAWGKDTYVGSEPPAGFVIKGNERSMYFHMPGGERYDRTIPDVWFRSEQEALDAGFKRSPR